MENIRSDEKNQIVITLDEKDFENFQLLISENLSFGFFQYKRSSDFYCSINSVENFEESTCLSDRDITPPTSDDEEPRRRLVDYSDTESSDDEDNIRPPPRKRRPMVIYSDTESSEDEDDEDLTSYYTIKTVNEKKSRLFRAQGKEFQLNIKTFPDNVPHLQFISRLFDWLVEDIKERCQMESNDKMRMTILHPGLKLGVFVPWRDVSAMTGEAILEEIMKVQQSNENFRIHDGQMTIQVTVVRLPVGSGRKPLHAGLYFESENMRKNKQSIIQINNTKDVMCMARAVVVAKYNVDKDD